MSHLQKTSLKKKADVMVEQALKIAFPKDIKPLLVAVADIHRTNARPICRIEEDIMETQDKKLNQVAKYAQSNQIPIAIAGDTFDTWKCGHDVVNSTLSILGKVPIYACYGQHELPNHDVLESWRSPATTLLLNQPCNLFTQDGRTIRIHTVHWGQRPKKGMVKNASTKVCNVLLIHKTVWLDEKPFPGAKGNVVKLCKRPEYNQFDVVISGDNHMAFEYVVRHEGKTTTWVNCGCLYRTDAGERNYIPCFWAMYFHEKMKCFRFKQIPVAYIKGNVTRKHLEIKDAEKEWDSEFVSNIVKTKGVRPSSYIENLKRSVLKDSMCVQKRVWQCVDGVMPF